MIPSEIGYFETRSAENEMYVALSKLPDDFYVFHSYRVLEMTNNEINENETDFLVFHPSYGCLVIEAKNGHVSRDENGDWHYSSGTKMKDPFDQACTSMHSILNKLRESSDGTRWSSYVSKCKFLFCVWFPAYSEKQIQEASFGPNISKNLIIPKEALSDPLPYIKRIMEEMQRLHVVYKEVEIIDGGPGYKHMLDKDNSIDFFKNVLCPSFDIVPNRKKEYESLTYLRLLREQYIILDFLSGQKSAAISGASGTGKTLVALERARRLSGLGNKILFLCYNNNLKVYLETNYPMADVKYYTIDGFACMMCDSSEPNYYKLNEKLENDIVSETFPYKHILVDEGQDFGRDKIDDSHVLDTLAEYGTSGDQTSFFIFYDKNQLINSKRLPSYLQNVDSKLTLYKNCRNTKKIADTAYSLIDLKVVTYEGALKGEDPRFIFYSTPEELEKRLDNVIEALAKDKDYDRVILTCKGTDSHSLTANTDKRTNLYKSLSGKKTKLYTCSTFKGLEADSVIMIDVGASSFDTGNLSFYIGASRAKKNLFVFVCLSDYELNQVLEKRFPNSFPKKDKRQQIALAMHGILTI